MNNLRVLVGLTLALAAVSPDIAQAANFKPVVPINKVPVRPIKPAPSEAHTYTFTLTKFKITDTRSVHEDTDFVSVAVAVGNNPPVSLPTKSMGDLNNGTFTVNLAIPATALPTDSVSFSYGIVNSGYDKNTLEQDMKKAVSDAASKGAKAGLSAAGDALIPGSGSIVSSVGSLATDWLIGKLLGIVFADCDGPVAAGDHVYSGSQLAAQTANGHVISVTDDNKGTDSPTGCGANSRYYVSWTVKG